VDCVYLTVLTGAIGVKAGVDYWANESGVKIGAIGAQVKEVCQHY
jgi:hypothetical protein